MAPRNEILEGILDRVDAILDLEERVGRLKLELSEEVHRISLIEPLRDREEVARHLYWRTPSVHVNDIAMGFHGRRKNKAFDQMIGAAPAMFECDDCGVVLEVTSRQQAKRLLDQSRAASIEPPKGHVCDACKAVRQSKEDERRAARNAQWRAHLAALRELSYQEYRQTDHWRALEEGITDLKVRALHGALWKDFPETCGPSCELCRTRANVDLRHKRDATLGAEDSDDTLLLCRSCGEVLEASSHVIPL